MTQQVLHVVFTCPCLISSVTMPTLVLGLVLHIAMSTDIATPVMKHEHHTWQLTPL